MWIQTFSEIRIDEIDARIAILYYDLRAAGFWYRDVMDEL